MSRAERRRAMAAGVAVPAIVAAATVAVEAAAETPVAAAEAPIAQAASRQAPALTRRAARAALVTPTEPFDWSALAEPANAVTPVTLDVVDADAARGQIVIAEVEDAPNVAADESVVADATGPEASVREDDERAAEGHRWRVSSEDIDVDEFVAAARLFNFTGETPIIREPVRVEPVPAAVHVVVPRRRGGQALRRMAAAGSSLVVMALAGVLAVGLTASPRALAVAAPASDDTAGSGQLAGDVVMDEDDIQAFVASDDVTNTSLERDEKYNSVTIAEIASDEGIQNFANTFVNDPNAAIQWPFDVGVPMSYGYGMRSGRLHEGIDFTPGSGAPIQAIADGVVRIATQSGGAYGVTVVIDHVVDGDVISSRYAHMQYGSLQVVPGQEVKVGDILGTVGATGRAYGAHLHFELHDASGDSFDPWPWMVEHTGN